MKTYNKLLLLFLVFALSMVGFVRVSDASSATTQTFARNRKGFFVVTQNAYLPGRTVFDFGIRDYAEANGIEYTSDSQFGLDAPQDIFIDDNDHIYIADMGNSRVVVYDPSTNETLNIIEKPEFSSPRGVFVTADNELYVADSGAHAVFKLKDVQTQDELDEVTALWEAAEMERVEALKVAALAIFRENPAFDFVEDEDLITAIDTATFKTVNEYFTDYLDFRVMTQQMLEDEIGLEGVVALKVELETTLLDPAITVVANPITPAEAGWHIIKAFYKPTSVSFESKSFDPKKVAVDNQDNMYIVAEGLLDGIVQLTDSGEFVGYFTSNSVILTAKQQIENLILSDEQLENKTDRNPPAFSNIYVDPKGIKYSTSFGDGVANLKKHNTDGSNHIEGFFTEDLNLLDVTTSNDGIIFTASQDGYIMVWTSDGSLIFGFGSNEDDVDVAGLYSELVSIDVDSTGTLWTLDSAKQFLQSYSPTEYSTTIYKALDLYRGGKYEEAVVEWEKVLRLNQLSVLAHNEIGRNLFSIGEYEEAMGHFELAGNRVLYSEAYWEVRNEELQKNLPGFLIGFVVITVAYYTIKFTNRKYGYLTEPGNKLKKIGNIKFINNLLFTTAFIKHPIDSFYYLKKKQKGSYLGASIIYGIMFVAYFIFLTSKGFIFQFVEAADMDLVAIVFGFFGLSLLFIICNYLVTSINDGEGSIGEIYKGMMYSLLPAIVAYLAVTVVSHYATYDDIFLLQVLVYTGLGWSGLLIYFSLQEIHNYTVRNTLKSILMTFLFMAIIIILLAFVQIMGDQLIQFIIALVKEAFRNVFY